MYRDVNRESLQRIRTRNGSIIDHLTRCPRVARVDSVSFGDGYAEGVHGLGVRVLKSLPMMTIQRRQRRTWLILWTRHDPLHSRQNRDHCRRHEGDQQRGLNQSTAGGHVPPGD